MQYAFHIVKICICRISVAFLEDICRIRIAHCEEIYEQTDRMAGGGSAFLVEREG